MTSMIRYEAAKAALAEARRVDEVLEIRNWAEQAKVRARQLKDRSMLADVSEIYVRAERHLGVLLTHAKEQGQFGVGRPGKSNLDAPESDDGEDDNATEVEVFSKATLKDAGIDHKLSSRSQKWARLGKGEFEQTLAAMREKIVSGDAVMVNPLKDVSTAGKKAKRAEREAELGKKQAALPEAKFGVIYADPEWKFQTYSEETGMDRSADNHYPTSDLETIKGRDVGSLAADDCVLFLWATVPMLVEALEVMKAWGFAYKSHFSWHKDRIGTGYWVRNKHELLLIGTRGHVPAPAMGDQFASVIEAPLGGHSAKPLKFYEIIEAYFPSLPKIELNARAARTGWARWGYEAPEESQAKASADGGATELGKEPADSVAGDVSRASVGAGPDASPLFTAEIDAIIREGDVARTALAELAVRTGLTVNQIKGRRRTLGLSSRDRQREAVAASNRRRAEA
jgi:N6-adenosine-specific RNA methylase IME4